MGSILIITVDAFNLNSRPVNTYLAYVSLKIGPQNVLSSFKPLTEAAICKLIKSSANKSCALDPMPTPLVVSCLDVLLPVITTIVNSSLLHGYFSSNWKEAIVTPTLKNPSLTSEFSNLRPISNLQFISKLTERAVFDQLQGTLRYTTASCYYGNFGREGLGWQLRFLRKPQTELRIRCTATGCSASTCLNKNGCVRLYSSFIRQRLDQWQWFPSLVSILRLPEIRFASQLLLQRPASAATWIPTTKQNNMHW